MLEIEKVLVRCGITTFEEEFIGQSVLPGGQILDQRLLPEIDEVQRTGKMPPLLPHLGG
ncbi:hypothetical protein [Rheinheimera soli]|uniref:hypothetical protein n=1 Tax=Rheinheimera soli TaxID=443616 RepID=UPI001E3967DD|nr:hypothetical protein [Rheinheimera soli]